MNKDRLLDAARKLRLVPREKFDISCFTNSGRGKMVEKAADLHACGASACLLGWLPAWYPEEWRYYSGSPSYRTSHSAYQSAIDWFEISWIDVHRLASPMCYQEYGCDPTPEQVADRIELFVKGDNEAIDCNL